MERSLGERRRNFISNKKGGKEREESFLEKKERKGLFPNTLTGGGRVSPLEERKRKRRGKEGGRGLSTPPYQRGG